MITILNTNTDGTLLGADEAGKLYVGTPAQISHADMTVKTEVAKDGKSFTRTTYLPSGELYGHSEITEAGFNEHNRLIGKTEDECKTLWEAEKAIESHGPGGSVNTIDWQAK